MRAIPRQSNESASGIEFTKATRLRALLVATAVCAVFSGTAFGQTATATGDMRMNVAASATPAADPPQREDPPKKHRHHAVAAADDRDERIDRLEREIEDLKAQISNQPQSQVSPAQFEALQNQVYETQAIAKAAATPQDKKIHFAHGMTFTFGGFLAAESVWRSRNLSSDLGSPGFSRLPFPGPGSGNSVAVGAVTGTAGVGNAVNIGHTQEFRFSARQSRVSGLLDADVSPDIHLSGYGEFDFLGAAASANSNESNSYQPRIRVVYGTVNWSDIGLHFLFGQSWSLATLNTQGISERSELTPPTIDPQYVVGFVWTRQPQLRLVQQVRDDLWIGFSVENPQTTLGGTAPSTTAAATGVTVISNSGNSFSGAGLNSTAAAEFNPGIQLSLNHVPDVLGKIAWEPDYFGGNVHLEAFGIYREFYDRTIASPGGVLALTTAANQNVSGGGGGISGLIKVFPGLFDIQFDAMYGSGIGRYASGQLPDATYGPDGVLRPINENLQMIGLTFHATPSLDIYIFGGRESEARTYFTTNGNGGYGNPNFNNTGCFSFNLTTACVGNIRTVEQGNIGLWDKVYNGDFGSFRIGLQYSYTYDRAFYGVGGTPHTFDNMVFTSFRYYPF